MGRHADGSRPAMQEVRLDHHRAQGIVAKGFLHGSEDVAVLEQRVARSAEYSKDPLPYQECETMCADYNPSLRTAQEYLWLKQRYRYRREASWPRSRIARVRKKCEEEIPPRSASSL